MKILNLKEKLFEKALKEWIESMDSISPEDILMKVEDFIAQKDKSEIKVG